MVNVRIEPHSFVQRVRLHDWVLVGEVTVAATEAFLDGACRGKVAHTSQFWFAWAAFHHDTAIWRAP